MILRNRQPNRGTKPTCPTWVVPKKQKKVLQVFRTRGSSTYTNVSHKVLAKVASEGSQSASQSGK